MNIYRYHSTAAIFDFHCFSEVSSFSSALLAQICVMAAGNFTVRPSVFPVIPAVSGIPSLCTGSARPYLVVNRILIYSGGLGLPHQQGWGSCSGVLSTLLSSATVFTTGTKREKAVGTVPTGRYGAKYTVLPTLLLNNN